MYIHNSSLAQFHQRVEPSESTLDTFLTQHLERYDLLEPHLHAFVNEVSRTDRIKDEVSRLKEKYLGLPKPALYGIPVGIKDLIHIDGWPTHAGSNLPPQVLASPEGSLIQKLKQKGAWFAGKTVTEEFAYGGPIPTRNPHHLEHTPGGSSAGSAAAVAAGICPFAVGTQTLRSVLAPASFCGVVGFKPSYGRIPIHGVQLMSPSFDTFGFFTQDIAGMEFIAGELVPDWRSIEEARKPVLGIPEGIYMTLLDDDVKKKFEDQIKKLKEAGFIVKTAAMPWEDQFIYGDAMVRFVHGEMAHVHESIFDQHQDLYHDSVKQAIIAGRSIEEEELERYRSGQIKLRNDLLDVQKTQGIDLWVSPAQGGTAPLWGTRTGWTGMTAIWSYAGMPAISIPSATVHNLPLGFQCIGAYGRDEELLCWSQMISQALN